MVFTFRQLPLFSWCYSCVHHNLIAHRMITHQPNPFSFTSTRCICFYSLTLPNCFDKASPVFPWLFPTPKQTVRIAPSNLSKQLSGPPVLPDGPESSMAIGPPEGRSPQSYSPGDSSKQRGNYPNQGNIPQASRYSKDASGKEHAALVMAYVSPSTDENYLSRVAMEQLKVIPCTFPQMGPPQL